MNLWECLTDPVFRGTTIGSMLMALASSLVGVLVFVKRRSLIGETLSHAAYPGVAFALVFCRIFHIGLTQFGQSIALIGALLFAMLGYACVQFLEYRCKVNSDAALCLVLSLFLGMGILIASIFQLKDPLLYLQLERFLYGQAATMGDQHILIYGILAFLILALFLMFFPQIFLTTFNRDYANTVGISIKMVDFLNLILLCLAIVTGIRSVGVILMAGMLISPAIAARQYSDRLSIIFLLSAIFGIVSAFFGVYFSIVLPSFFHLQLSLSTGPMILLMATAICFFSLLFAPKKGVVSRIARMARFRFECLLENILKAFWKNGSHTKQTKSMIFAYLPLTFPLAFFALFVLQMQGWVIKIQKNQYQLTSDGIKRATNIIRLHRLWEVYLLRYLHMSVDKVHRSAEEIEHILSGDLEASLVQLLQDPEIDPHFQVIPAKEELI